MCSVGQKIKVLKNLQRARIKIWSFFLGSGHENTGSNSVTGSAFLSIFCPFSTFFSPNFPKVFTASSSILSQNSSKHDRGRVLRHNLRLGYLPKPHTTDIGRFHPHLRQPTPILRGNLVSSNSRSHPFLTPRQTQCALHIMCRGARSASRCG